MAWSINIPDFDHNHLAANLTLLLITLYRMKHIFTLLCILGGINAALAQKSKPALLSPAFTSLPALLINIRLLLTYTVRAKIFMATETGNTAEEFSGKFKDSSY